MKTENKCVMIIDSSLPAGIIANTAAILGVTLGRELPDIVGNDVIDANDSRHLGIIKIPIPILNGTPELLKALRERLYRPEFGDLTVVDFSDLAQGCNTYEEFSAKMKTALKNELRYFGIAIYGPKKKVNKLTGSVPLLR